MIIIFASKGFTTHSAPLHPLVDFADKIKTRATESDWLRRQAIAVNLLIGGVVRNVFIQNSKTIIIIIFT